MLSDALEVYIDFVFILQAISTADREAMLLTVW